MQVALTIVVVAALVAWYAATIRCGADRDVVRAPNGHDYDVLVNPDGVPLYLKEWAWFGGPGGLLSIVGLVRRLRGRQGWTVRVRPHPYRGYADLRHEPMTSRAEALARQAALVEAVRSGEQLWPADAEWYR